MDSWDVDLRVWGEDRAREVQHKLETIYPGKRWHVKDALSWSRKEIGRTVSSVEESIAANALICICLGVRWRDDRVQLCWGNPEAKADLCSGLLRPNQNGQLGFASAKAMKIAAYYAGVSAPFIGHDRVSIKANYSDAIHQCQSQETGGRKQWSSLSIREERIARALAGLREALDRTPQPVPWPVPAEISTGNPWLADDRYFRAWIVNQVRSRTPFGGRDAYLEHALKVQEGVAQKPTHLGWDLRMHVFHALLQLETDNLIEFRRPLRLAMLWHDVGKLWNINTPGAHAAIGSNKWITVQKYSISGITATELRLISHFISIHDLFGRLERSLWDDSYQGAISPKSVIRMLQVPTVPTPAIIAIAKALWLADVASIPLLRWLTPLANHLEALVTQAAES